MPPSVPPSAPPSGAAELAHLMTPTTVAVLLLLAVAVDYMSIGPNSLRDRLAFLLALPAIREGFDGSPLDKWTVGALSGLIDQAKRMTGGAYIAGATTSYVLGAAIGLLAVYAIGALLPDKTSRKLGRWAGVKLPAGSLHRLNTKLWALAVVLGMLCDLPGGLVGDTVRVLVDALTGLTAGLPELLFGAEK